ncbi:MAG: DNA-methyltransferase [Candidatus Ranarchaeia archaeon]
MNEVDDESVHLMVTSPPYFNAPFDYPDLFSSYEQYLTLLRNLAKELWRVIANGRIAAFVTDDMLIKGQKYPIVADTTKIMMKQGFKYRDRITWKKPEGYIRISRRSGVLLQHPYPMYYYPDNLTESILLFQKGKFNYKEELGKLKSKSKSLSEIDLEEYQREKWFLNLWEITNVLPKNNRIERGIAAFPDEIPYRLIKLFSFIGETVLDPFLGSGTTMKVARQLSRSCIGYEIDGELEPVIKKKLDFDQKHLTGQHESIDIIRRR